MTDTLEYWLEIIIYLFFFVHFCGNPGSKVARGVRVDQPCRDSNPRPSNLQPDAMTIRPRRHCQAPLYASNGVARFEVFFHVILEYNTLPLTQNLTK